MIFACSFACDLPAKEVRLSGGPARVSLLELYTSEGCSSCPPAERWFAALGQDRRLWTDFVPVSFHVNYWDRLGWPDRFARKDFTERQYALAAAWSQPSVYTPCFVRDGAEWHPRGSHVLPGDGSPGLLELIYDEATGEGRAEFAPKVKEGSVATTSHSIRLHVVLLGGGLYSRVTAGENDGSRLEHEFVALDWVDCPFEPAGEGKMFRARWKLPDLRRSGATKLALAAWVTSKGSLIPIQAVGGWLP